MLQILRDGVLSILYEDQDLANRKTYREKYKRNLRPHRQLEPAQNLEWDRGNAVGCSLTIKADEVFCF